MRPLFSQRYRRPLEQAAIVVDIPEEARRKLWAWLVAKNPPLRIQRDPYDNWQDSTSALEEAESDLLREHGWDRLPVIPYPRDEKYFAALKLLVNTQPGQWVFDTIELFSSYMDKEESESLRQKVNQIFELHDCPWRMSDGEFFKLDADFVGARLAADAHDNLAGNQFAGAANEYAKARQYLASGETREAIFFAGHSFESVMKVLTGLENANGDRLIKKLVVQGFFDDLPETMRAGFADQVLRTVPFVRNKLGGHGQGKEVLEVPAVYGDLAIQLAAALQNFLVAKYLERSPPPPKAPEKKRDYAEDEIPF